MENRHYFALLAVLALAPFASCRCSRGGADRPPPALAETSFDLPNGLAVDLVSGPCGESVSLAVLVRGGLDFDPPGRSGLALVAGQVLSTPEAAKAGRAVETGGADTLWSVTVPAERLPAELDAVAAWMRGAPSEADLARAKAAVLGELAGGGALARAVSLAEESVLPTPGGGKRRGVAAEVEALTLAELQAYWQGRFKPGNARVVVVGRFDAPQVRSHLETAFSALPAGTPPAPREPVAATVKGTLVMGQPATALAIAVPAPAQDSPLFPAFLIEAARLLAPAQPAHSWQAAYDPLRRPELLLLTSPVGPAEAPEPAAARVRAEADAILARPLAPADVAAARERFRLFLEPRALDPASCAKDPRGLASARAWRAQAGAVAPLDQVTADQLAQAARLFAADQTAAVLAGDAPR